MKELVVVTATYPYDVGEEFMYKELKEASKYFERIIIYPLEKPSQELRYIPENAIVSDILCDKKFMDTKKQWGLLLSLFLQELSASGRFWYVLRNALKLLSSLHQCDMKARLLQGELESKKLNDPYFYSVWMNDGATILGILKRKGFINYYVLRLHGYDLFDERRDGNYMPFRTFNFKWTNRIFVLSKAGAKYTVRKAAKIGMADKVEYNYSGLYDHGEGPFELNSEFTIVSCSNMHRFKRVEMIFDALKLIDFPCIWYHIGDGEQYTELTNRLEELPGHVKAIFKGRISNVELIELYKTHSVNLFVHLSTTEGLGMAAVEAQSFGIPALSVDVGGVKEVVHDGTGILLTPDVDAERVAIELTQFKASMKNTESFRKRVRDHFLRYFSAEKNYKSFFDKIIKYKSHK